MKLRVVAVGGLRHRAERELVDEYLGRVVHYCGCEHVEVKAAPPAALEKSLARATDGAAVVVLDVAGKVLSSEALARRLERLASRGKGVVAFVIGGAEGLPPAVVARADERWSLSALTFPHRLARVMLAEQLYRAMTILRGEPYAR